MTAAIHRACMQWLLLALFASCTAAPLKVMYGVSRPPFVDEAKGNGISIELMEEALHRLHLHAIKLYGGNKRMEAELREGRIDAAVEIQPTDKNLYYSRPFLAYRNFAVSQDGNDYPDWASMRGKSVCAWQNASENLGPAFAKASRDFGEYIEYPQQLRQVQAWVARHCAIILIDDTLLRQHLRSLHHQAPRLQMPSENQMRFSPLINAHELWWHVGFRDETLRNRFDNVLEAMRADGSYQRIRERYNAPGSASLTLTGNPH